MEKVVAEANMINDVVEEGISVDETISGDEIDTSDTMMYFGIQNPQCNLGKKTLKKFLKNSKYAMELHMIDNAGVEGIINIKWHKGSLWAKANIDSNNYVRPELGAKISSSIFRRLMSRQFEITSIDNKNKIMVVKDKELLM